MSFMEYFESSLGYLLYSVRGHDDKLLTKSAPFAQFPEATLTVTSADCGASGSAFDRAVHSQLGKEQFPQLAWSSSSSSSNSPGTGAASSAAKQYLVVVEDPDAPFSQPITHGIYYGIPASKLGLEPGDFEVRDSERRLLSGGFMYGKNRRDTVYMGPRAFMGHGPHRYTYQVVALSEELELATRAPTKEEIIPALQGKVVGWGVWRGTFERTM